jgi:hypothetical protein
LFLKTGFFGDQGYTLKWPLPWAVFERINGLKAIVAVYDFFLRAPMGPPGIPQVTTRKKKKRRHDP